ncbi:MAG: DEAD/DEAH box helicase, partial [Planctomycetota bacterium]
MAAARTRTPREKPAEDLPLHALPLTELAGVGPARAARLAQLGVNSVHELLCVLPRRLERASSPCTLAEARSQASLCAREAPEDLPEDDEADESEPLGTCRVRGSVVRQRFSRFGSRSLLRVAISDGAESLELLFFNQPWLRERFRPGDAVEAEGRPAWAKGAALVVRRLGSASAPLPAPGTLSPVYPGTEGLSQDMLRGLCRQALEQFGARVSEPLPAQMLAEHGLLALPEAVRELHEPQDEARHSRARARLALEPLIALRASLEARRRERARTAALVVHVDDGVEREIRALFPFAFTGGQQAIARTLREDLERGHPMRRLLQGDVGSGKTALGAYACLLAARAGAQAAFLAPTELLAEQHLRGLAPLFARAGLRTALLCGSLAARERRTVLAALAGGEIDVLFGTHALFSEAVRFARLGLAVIDEQHRFGVAQRERLFDKGRD